MSDFVGLKNLTDELHTIAKMVKPFPHTLLHGPRGCGKTSLSREIGKITGQRLVEVNAPVMDKMKMYNLLLAVKPGDILFIDEIHRLNPAVEEIIYQPMESQTLTLAMRNRVQTVKFVPFTLVGATTRPAMISKPLMSRFKVQLAVPRYNVRELARMIMAKYQYTRREALEIAQYTMVPREALNLAFRIRTLARPINQALQFLGLVNGTTIQERQYLKLLDQGNTVSLNTLASYLQLDSDSVQELEERLLIKGFVEISGRGRNLTLFGRAKLNGMASV